jgi:hypothetical protein
MEATKTQTRPRKVARDHSHNSVLCARSVALLNYYLLGEGILPSVPQADINGYDVVTDYNGKMQRVQVRATGFARGQKKPPESPRSFTFSILRNKKKRRIGDVEFDLRRHFQPGEVDVFIFIHVDYQKIFVVDAEMMDLSKTKFTVYAGQSWEQAWWVLKNGGRNNVG